ncbi:MAG: PKD domain-containing protein, partial [Proteobacteria bacterium]|nr:PKD domain-containing protein [Pseudomonadota bacterium]
CPTVTTTYTLTVTDVYGCIAQDQVVVTVYPAITASAGSDVSICSGGSVQIGGSPTASDGTSPYTYLWSPATGLSSTTTANPNASPTSTTPYTVTVTDANGCQNTDQITVTVNPCDTSCTVTANAGADDAICSGSCTSLNGQATGGSGGYAYSWSPVTGLSNPDIANPEACPQITTTYTLTVTDNNGCQDSDNTTVTVSQGPTAQASSNSPVCEGATIELTSGPSGMNSYAWTGPNSWTSSLQNLTRPNATTAMAGTYALTVTDGNGCTDTNQITVTVNPCDTSCTVTANAGADDAICSGSCATLNGQATGGTPDYTYSWSPSTGLSDPDIVNPDACPQTTTTYTLTVTDDNGCTDNDQVTVTVNPNPTANAGSDDTICSGSCTTIGGLPAASGGTGPYTYSWNPADGLSNPDIANPEACPQTTTTYTLTVTDSNGCTDEDQIVVTVYISTLVANFSATPTSGCAPLTVGFTNDCTGLFTDCAWDFGDGGASTDTNPTYAYVRPGLYTVVLSVTDQCGLDTKSSLVIVGEHISDSSGGTATTQDSNVRIDFDPGDLETDGWIVIDQAPEDTTGTIPANYYRLGQTVVELVAYDSGGNLITNFASDVLLVLYYLDVDQDGIVDDSNPPIDELTLKICKLENGQWVEMSGSIVDIYANAVSVALTHFSIYILMGQSVIAPNVNNVLVYPNPFKPGKGDAALKFLNLTPDATIRIYNVAGELVRIKENITTGAACWDGKNDHGKPVASGGYFYIITDNEGRKKTGKIAVIW